MRKVLKIKEIIKNTEGYKLKMPTTQVRVVGIFNF